MIGLLVRDGAADEDVRKYFNALRRAQRDIGVEPEAYKHYLLKELPAAYKAMLDTRVCGIGERLAFEPYTREIYEKIRGWMVRHNLFEGADRIQARYADAVVG